MPSYALSAIGPDRPGIVAAIAKVLYEHGCNVEDSSMTMLRGNFAVMLVLAAPGGVEAQALEDALCDPCGELGLLYSVRAVDDEAVHPHPTHTLTVYGADRPGILFRVSEALAETGINITDLSSRLVGESTAPVYVLMLELAAPRDTDIDGLEVVLRQIASQVGVDLTMRPFTEDVL